MIPNEFIDLYHVERCFLLKKKSSKILWIFWGVGNLRKPILQQNLNFHILNYFPMYSFTQNIQNFEQIYFGWKYQANGWVWLKL